MALGQHHHHCHTASRAIKLHTPIDNPSKHLDGYVLVYSVPRAHISLTRQVPSNYILLSEQSEVITPVSRILIVEI